MASTTGTITSAGIGSGLDVEGIISKLVTLEKQPLTQLQTKATSIQTQLSTYGQIKSLVSTLQDAASKLALDSGWNSMAISSTNSSAVNATVTGIATPGTYSLEVQQLARAQSVASQAYASGTAVGGGTMTIQLGSWVTDGNAPPAVTGFTPASSSGVNIAITSTDSINTIATKINNANAGVTATVISDASGQRLLVRSNATGEASGFRIQVAEDSGSPGLSALAFDPQASATGGMAANTYQLARNTQATLNGVALTSTDNTFANVVPGMKITVGQVTTSAVDLSVSADKTTITKNIQAFVDAYNAVNQLLADSTKYDDATKTAGVLQADATTVGLQNSLRSLVTSTTVGGAFSRLSDIGITFQQGGALSVDSTKLDNALTNNLADVKQLFAADNNNAGTNGLARKFKDFTYNLLSFDGTINSKSDSLQTAVKSNTSDQDKVNARAAAVEAQLRAQYTALDTQMASLTSLSTYMTQQIANWNKSS